ncbi:MAG: hypothetical protein H7Y27_09300 [Gemmatimonadaceae bacterium]|nr:hypothetical protein [Chitinophagaceae bacterium]
MRNLFILLLFSFSVAEAQTVTGSWYGIADATKGGRNSNNYLTELIIKQKGNEIEGVFGYYFRNGYQSYFIRGNYNPRTRVVTIKNIPVTYFKSLDIDGIDCPMDFSAVFLASQVQSTLKGSFISHEKYKYTCPELRVSYSLDVNEKNQDSLIRNSSAGIKKYWKPRNEELVVTPTGDIITTRPPAGYPVDAPDTTGVALEKKKAETAALVKSFEERKTIYSSDVLVESDSIRISFYDNGDIDGDSISVFINKIPVLTRQPLTAQSLNIYMAFDKDKPETQISMYADNLGKFPPNTALMVVTDGDKRYEVYMSSTLTQNATVRLRKKPAPAK